MKMMKKKSVLFLFIVLSGFLRLLLLAQEKVEIQDDNELIYYLIAAAAILLIVIVTLAVVMISSSNKDNLPKEIDDPYQPNPPPNKERSSGSKIVENSIFKTEGPTHGTLKLLPGYLEVVDGDDRGEKIGFYNLRIQGVIEKTFGRRSGPPDTHVQLKPKSVSFSQARIIYTNGKYLLINCTEVNPTMVNDEPLPKDGSVTLEEGDKIKMGEVSFIFHEK